MNESDVIEYYNGLDNSIQFVSNYSDRNEHFTGRNIRKEKNKYKNLRSAFAAAHALVERYGGNWVIYKCSICDNYHFGK